MRRLESERYNERAMVFAELSPVCGRRDSISGVFGVAEPGNVSW